MNIGITFGLQNCPIATLLMFDDNELGAFVEVNLKTWNNFMLLLSLIYKFFLY